jgi:transcriptional regulator with XRE-family HTH domain
MDTVFIGKRIQEQRKLKKLTQDNLSEIVGISKNYLSEVERGNKEAGVVTFANIAKALDVPADLLLRDIVDSGKPFVLNDLTEKMKELSPAQLKFITDLVYLALDNFPLLVVKADEAE